MSCFSRPRKHRKNLRFEEGFYDSNISNLSRILRLDSESDSDERETIMDIESKSKKSSPRTRKGLHHLKLKILFYKQVLNDNFEDVYIQSSIRDSLREDLAHWHNYRKLRQRVHLWADLINKQVS